jgi:hypothetical protein
VRRKRRTRGSPPARDARGLSAVSGTTLVLDDSHSDFSTDAINHDLIALPICCASRDLLPGRRCQKETPNDKIKNKNSEMPEETPEQ